MNYRLSEEEIREIQYRCFRRHGDKLTALGETPLSEIYNNISEAQIQKLIDKDWKSPEEVEEIKKEEREYCVKKFAELTVKYMDLKSIDEEGWVKVNVRELGGCLQALKGGE